MLKLWPVLAARRGLWVVFVLAALLSLLFLLRSEASGDQLNLLARGWLFVTQGELIPYGNPTSGGGVSPGSVTSLLMGLPLLVWRDARAPILLLFATHLIALLLLDRVVARCWGRDARVCFALLFGLSPLRLYLSGLLWNPGFMILAGATHVWTAYQQRNEPRAVSSFLHVLTLGLAAQIHLSAAILVCASLFLWRRAAMRVHWWGAVTGALLVGLSLVPYLVQLVGGGLVVPASSGFIGRGLLLVYPLSHGIWNLVRSASLSLPKELIRFDFTGVAGAEGDLFLAPLAFSAARTAEAVTLLVALAALWRFSRRMLRSGVTSAVPAGISDRAWLKSYVACCYFGALVLFCAAPTTPMWWQGAVVLHAAVLPAAAFGAALCRSRRRALARRGALAWAGMSLALSLALAFGTPHMRCGGRYGVNLQLAEHYPMLDDLGMMQRCAFPIVESGWWPDLFPPKPAGAAELGR